MWQTVQSIRSGTQTAHGCLMGDLHTPRNGLITVIIQFPKVTVRGSSVDLCAAAISLSHSLPLVSSAFQK